MHVQPRGDARRDRRARNAVRIALAILLLVACRSTSTAPDQKALNTEAQVQLNKLSKSLKAHWNTHGRFPDGKTGPLPVARCCTSARGVCPVTTAWRSDPLWSRLAFEVLDPGRFQFAYESDGTTATATAIADLDCDGTPITYTLKLTAKDGVPHAVLDQPSIGAD